MSSPGGKKFGSGYIIAEPARPDRIYQIVRPFPHWVSVSVLLGPLIRGVRQLPAETNCDYGEVD